MSRIISNQSYKQNEQDQYHTKKSGYKKECGTFGRMYICTTRLYKHVLFGLLYVHVHGVADQHTHTH